jgi:hypothetical protein
MEITEDEVKMNITIYYHNIMHGILGCIFHTLHHVHLSDYGIKSIGNFENELYVYVHIYWCMLLIRFVLQYVWKTLAN